MNNSVNWISNNDSIESYIEEKKFTIGHITQKSLQLSNILCTQINIWKIDQKSFAMFCCSPFLDYEICWEDSDPVGNT